MTLTHKLHTGVEAALSMSLRKRIGTVLGLSLFATIVAAPGAVAADCGAAASGTSPIITLFAQLTWYVIAIGGVGAVLVGVVGALFIMFSAGNSERATKGMTIVKNALIGLAIMGGIFLLRTAVTSFVGGTYAATGNPNCSVNQQTALPTQTTGASVNTGSGSQPLPSTGGSKRNTGN